MYYILFHVVLFVATWTTSNECGILFFLFPNFWILCKEPNCNMFASGIVLKHSWIWNILSSWSSSIWNFSCFACKYPYLSISENDFPCLLTVTKIFWVRTNVWVHANECTDDIDATVCITWCANSMPEERAQVSDRIITVTVQRTKHRYLHRTMAFDKKITKHGKHNKKNNIYFPTSTDPDWSRYVI